MNNLKVGENAYWFQIFDGMNGIVPLEDLQIEHTKICCDSEIKQRHWCYPSRRAAIEALAARLNELLKEC